MSTWVFRGLQWSRPYSLQTQEREAPAAMTTWVERITNGDSLACEDVAPSKPRSWDLDIQGCFSYHSATAEGEEIGLRESWGEGREVLHGVEGEEKVEVGRGKEEGVPRGVGVNQLTRI